MTGEHGVIDAARLLGAAPTVASTTWSTTDVILHHLGIGAAGHGQPDLRYVHERALVVLPSFATVLAQDAASALVCGLPLGVDPASLVQGEHELRCHRPIPKEGSAQTTAWVESVWDRDTMAVLVVRADTTTAAGESLATNRYHLLLPGRGGFGGDRGAPATGESVPRTRSPGVRRVLTTTVLPHQQATFRLSGDRSALHIDPAAARALGFPAAPVAGLCTFGTVLRVALDGLVDGDVTRFASFRARFTAAVYPGDRLEIGVEGDGPAWDVQTIVPQRTVVALQRTRLLLHGEPEPGGMPGLSRRPGVTAST
jgi:acyl dehydratase